MHKIVITKQDFEMNPGKTIQDILISRGVILKDVNGDSYIRHRINFKDSKSK